MRAPACLPASSRCDSTPLSFRSPLPLQLFGPFADQCACSRPAGTRQEHLPSFGCLEEETTAPAFLSLFPPPVTSQHSSVPGPSQNREREGGEKRAKERAGRQRIGGIFFSWAATVSPQPASLLTAAGRPPDPRCPAVRARRRDPCACSRPYYALGVIQQGLPAQDILWPGAKGQPLPNRRKILAVFPGRGFKTGVIFASLW